MIELDPAAQVMAFFSIVALLVAIFVRWRLHKDQKHKS